MYIALRVSGPKVSEHFMRNVDCPIQNDSYTYVTAMKLNNWDAVTSETGDKKMLKTGNVYFRFMSPPCIADPRNARWEHQCRYSDVGINFSTCVNWTFTPAGLGANIWTSDTRQQFTWSHCYDMSLHSNCSLPCRCHFKDNVWTPAMPNLTAGLAGLTTNGQLTMILYIMWLYFPSQSYVSIFLPI